MYSVVIIAKNESRIIAKTIEAWKNVSRDVIIVTDNPADGTDKIAMRKGCRVFQHKWEGYGANKNFGNAQAEFDWILCPDADEIPDEKLLKSIKELQPVRGKAYTMNMLNYLVNTPVYHSGWHPQFKIKLFNRNDMHWNDAAVHEKLISSAPVLKVKLPGLLHHHSYVNLDHYQQKLDQYARLRAEEWHLKGNVPFFLKRYYGPMFRLFRTYFLKSGVMDGKTGWYIACSEFRYKQKEWKYFDDIRKNSSTHP